MPFKTARATATHTVYTLPRELEWHALQRMPEIVECELQTVISEVADAFVSAGLVFQQIVMLSCRVGSRRAEIDTDFGTATMPQLHALGGRLADQFEFPDLASRFKLGGLNRTQSMQGINLMLERALTLDDFVYDKRLREQEAVVRETVPPHLIRPPLKKHNRADWHDELGAGDGALPLCGPLDQHGVDTLIAEVFAKAPWMNAPLLRIWKLMKAKADNGLRFPPILLHGPGGTGKSMLARLISNASGVPSHEMDGSAGAAAFRVAGVESGWAGSRIGEPLRFIAESRCPNPIMVINELDKATGGARTDKGTETSLINALLPLLDPHSADSWRCPASGLVCDLSRINWLFTANHLEGLSQPFLSRLEVIHIPALTETQYLQAVEVMCPDDDLVRETAQRFVREEWRRPAFSLRLLARTIQRLSADQRPDFH